MAERVRRSTVERQEQILDEAIRIIHHHGYGALAIRELARRVGISEPAIYRHFKNKEEIVIRILDRILDMSDSMRSELESLPSSQDKIRGFVRFHFEFLKQNPEITSVVFSENVFYSDPALKHKLRAILDSRHFLLKSLIVEARREGGIADVNPDDLAILIVGNIRLTVLEWRLSEFAFDLKRRGSRVLRTLEKLIFI